jgi:hypothetical protein
MRLVLPRYGSCGKVEPMLGPAVQRLFAATGVMPTGVWR